MAAFTVVSVKLTFPVLFRAGAVAIWTNGPPSSDRSMMNPLSFVALSLQVRLTFGPA